MSRSLETSRSSRRRGLARWPAWLVGVALTTSSLASGQGAPSRADVLFREGREATKKQDHTLACQKFAESYALDEAPGTLVNLGSCEEKLGRASQAWRHLTDAVSQLPSTDDRIPVVKGLLEGLDKKIARLTLKLTNVADGANLKVRLDGLEVPPQERRGALVVNPGEHVVLGRTDDGREARQVVQALAGQALEVDLLFPPAASEPGNVTPLTTAGASTGAAPRSKQPGRTRRIAGYTAGGVGLVGLGVGVAFLLKSRSSTSDAKAICVDNPGSCPVADVGRHGQLVDDAKSANTVATVGLVAGGALVALGVVLVATAPTARSSTGLRLQLQPEVSPQQAAFSLHGAW